MKYLLMTTALLMGACEYQQPTSQYQCDWDPDKPLWQQSEVCREDGGGSRFEDSNSRDDGGSGDPTPADKPSASPGPDKSSGNPGGGKTPTDPGSGPTPPVLPPAPPPGGGDDGDDDGPGGDGDHDGSPVKNNRGHGNGDEGDCRGAGCTDPDNPGKGKAKGRSK